MKNKQIAVTEEIVKYIFPTTNPEIIQGEDGYIVCDFRRLYPNQLAIFLPNEVDQSNYSSAFPKPFEDYFASAIEEAAFLSRLFEAEIRPNLRKDLNVEFVPGKVVRTIKSDYTVFRFDELIDAREKTEVLCRVKLKDMVVNDRVDIINSDPLPNFMKEAIGPEDEQLYYWIMPISELFRIDRSVVAAFFAYVSSLRKNGPF